MKGKDDIEQLFQEKLGNFQPKVNPNLWNGIQAGLTGTTSAVTGTSMSILAKTLIGIGTVAVIGTGIALLLPKDSEPTNTKPVNQEIQTKAPVVDAVEDKNIISSTENTIDSEENKEKIAVIEYEPTIVPVEKHAMKNIQAEKFESNNATPITPNNNEEQQSLIEPEQKPSVEKVEPIQEETLVDFSKIAIIVEKKSNQYYEFSAANLPENAIVNWNFGNNKRSDKPNCEYFFDEAGTYTVTLNVKAGEQQFTKKETVSVLLSGEIQELPNIFTPNGDGNNDEFFVRCKNIKTFQLTVMDQNQNVVFTTNDVNFKWNGIDRSGNMVKEGNYIYIIIAKDTAGNIINKYQNLRILR